MHLDLKPDNILLGSRDLYEEESSTLILIDFGISKTYVNEVGSHIEMRDDEDFSGNIQFSSKFMFEYFTQSRRDDFISLSYLLAYFVNGKITWLPKREQRDPNKDLHDQVAQIKKDMRPEDLCVESAEGLKPFVEVVWALDFKEEPDYDKL